ncbi:protein kinase domain-containing protein [Engelhardtia mirabilis]|uniref:protein kinase domain-containing protein n=1 Tax=Engelhardtia mirabilis TaxID=2528011 RepID=UPI0011A12597
MILRAYARSLEVGAERELASLRREHPELRHDFEALDNAWTRLAPLLGLSSHTPTAPQRPGADVDPGISLDRRPGSAPSGDGAQGGPLLDRIASRSVPPERYRARREIARGGMGSIQSVWDEDLRRHLVMKVMLQPQDRDPGVVSRPPDSRQISRFLEEAQITSQLDHPSIVPVHDIGIDEQSRLYFTMPLVQGEELGKVIAKARAGEDGWTRTRLLSVLVKVMEAVAFAHSRGVIHRDLKPENIMVGRFGQTYVMDWGLARVLDETERAEHEKGKTTLDVIRDRVKRGGKGLRRPQVRTERHTDDRGDRSSVDTLDGDVVGTPGYMAPEQALGQRDKIGPRADIYAIGSILYQLLTGYRPFDDPVSRESGSPLFERILESEPVDIRDLEKDCPTEIVAITKMAMAHDQADRYESMLAMIDDVRAYLEGHVVRAYEAGLLAEVRKWIVRNRVLASTVGIAGAAVIGLIVLFVWQQQRNLSDMQAEQKRTELARNQAVESSIEEQRQRQLAEAARQEENRARAKAEDQAAEAERQRSLADNRRIEVEQIANELRLREAVQRRLRYAANLRAADIALAANDQPEARRQLEACEDDLRGWEWAYLAQRVDLSLGSIERCARDPVDVAALGGGEIGVLAADESLALWYFGADRAHQRWKLRAVPKDMAYDADSGLFVVSHGLGPLTVLRRRISTELRRLVDPTAFDLEFGPLDLERGGGRVVAGVIGSGSRGRERSATVFDTSNAKPLAALSGRRARIVTAVSWSQDGAWLAIGYDDGQFQLYDGIDYKLIDELAPHSEAITALTFSDDNSRLVCASADDSATVFDIASRGALFALRGHTGPITAALFGSDDRWIATASTDRSVRVWDAGSGVLQSTLNGHRGTVVGLDLEPDTGRLISLAADRSVRAWDPSAGAPASTIDMRRSRSRGWVDFSPDSKRVVLPNAFSAQVLDLRTLEPVAAIGDGSFLSGRVRHSPDGALLVAPSLGELVAWDSATGERAGVIGKLPRQFSLFELSRDGSLAVASGPMRAQFDLDGSERDGPPPDIVALWADPLAALRSDGDAAGNFEFDADWTVDLPRGVSALALLPIPGRRDVLVACSDGAVRRYDVRASGALQLTATLLPERGRIWAGFDQVARIAISFIEALDGSGFHLAARLVPRPEPLCLSIAPQTGILAVGASDGAVDLWNLADGSHRTMLVGHEGAVNAVQFSPDGSRLLTASNDESLRIWEVQLGESLIVLRNHEGPVLDARFTPDGSRIVSVGSDGTARLWETEPQEERFDARRRAREKQRAARQYLLGTLDRFVSTTELMEAISDDASLTEPMRKQIADYVRFFGENATRLASDAWSVVQDEGREQEEYEDALAWSLFACSLEPEQSIFLRTLGIAQFRMGLNQACIETLLEAGQMHRRGQRIEELAVLAMAYAEIGEQDNSDRFRREFETMMEESMWSKNGLVQALDRELRDRLGSAPAPLETESQGG